MDTHPDFEGFLSLLQKHRVDYLLVGGYAVAYHGHPRFTKDLDIFYGNQPENIVRLQKALIEFGFEPQDIASLAFERTGEIIRFGLAPVMIDLLNHIDGVAFEDAFPRRVTGIYGTTETLFISKQDLIKNKQSTHRLKDKADAEELA